jgi:uncharacterized protein YjbI with pentapeptide repeats
MSNESLKVSVEGGRLRLNKADSEAVRTIEAEWIAKAVGDGKKIEIWNAIIHGPLNLRGTTVRDQLAFSQCVFQDPIDLSGSTLQSSLIFSATTLLGPVNLRNTTVNCDFILNRSRFKGLGNSFINMCVKGYVMAVGAQFSRATSFDDASFGPDVKFNRATFARVSFNSVRITGSAHFDRARFGDACVFTGLDVGGDLDFVDTRFAPGHNVGFEVLRVGGDASFNRAVFGEKVFFDGSQIDGQASFCGVEFANGASFTDAKIGNDLMFRRDSDNGTATAFKLKYLHGPSDATPLAVDFTDAHIDGNFDCRSIEVEGGASFVGVVVGGGCVFRGARFNSDSKVRFDLAHFRGGAFFQGTQFSGETDFRGVQIDLDARFSGADFRRAASFEAAKFTGLVTFAGSEWAKRKYEGSLFERASFKHARCEQDAHFDDAVFRGDADFRDATFQVLYFARSPEVPVGGLTVRQFQRDIDLRGCTYKAIDGDWRPLLPRKQRVVEYNRQPYNQMEKFLSSIGQSDVADQVYLERRAAERQWKWRKRRPLAWLVDASYFVFLRYGVRPWQLLILSAGLLFLGTLFFSQPHTVMAKKEKEIAPAVLPRRDAFELSLHQFLPVEIPLGEQWGPDHEGIDSKPGFLIRPTTFATLFLRLPGWILVPLGIASFTRLLRGAGSAKGGGGE